MPGITSYLPDPSKWIDTSSSTRLKGPTQRPLIGFKGGVSSLATPPASVRRSNKKGSAAPGPSTIKRKTVSSHPKGAVAKDAVIDLTMGGLDAWLTPPESSQRPASRPRRAQDSAQRRGSPKARSVADPKKVAERAFWGSDGSNDHEQDQDEKSGAVEPIELPDSGRAGRPVHRGLLNLVEEEKAPSMLSSPGTIPSSHIHTAASSSTSAKDPSSDPPPSSPPSLTIVLPAQGEVTVAPSSDVPTPRVPDKVLEVHRRLCGQDQQQMDEIASPWRPRADNTVPQKAAVSPNAKRKLQKENSKILAVLSKEVLQQRAEKENLLSASKGKGKDKVLVILSDDEDNTSETTPSKRRRTTRPLGVVSANTLRFGRSPPPLHPPSTASARKYRPASRAPQQPTAPLRTSVRPASGLPSPRTSSDRETTPVQLLPVAEAGQSITPINRRSPSLHSPTGHGVASQGAAPIPPPQPIFSLPRKSGLPSAPAEARTPANRRSPSLHSPEGHGVSQLPAPEPPAQPVFVPTSSGKPKREWKPVGMQPETLLEWGLAGPELPEEVARADKAGLDTSKLSTGEGLARLRRRSTNISETIVGTVPSQVFPKLVSSSPGGQGSDDPLDDVLEDEELLSLAPTVPSQAFPAVAASPVARIIAKETPWLRRSPRLNKRQSTVVSHGSAQDKAGSSSQKRRVAVSAPKKGKKPTQMAEGDQSKLAQYGFFGSPKKLLAARDFDQAWQDEQDLDFGGDDEPDEGEGNEATPTKRAGNLRSVPEAPYHPHLRPAGIREIERRAIAKRNMLGPTASEAIEHDPPSFSPPAAHTRAHDTAGPVGESLRTATSSQTSVDTRDERVMDEGVQDWWANLGQRRSSEFDV